MDDYLSKPFVQDQLQAVLLRWMPPRPGESALNGAHQTVKPAVNESSVPVAAHTHHTNGPACRDPATRPSHRFPRIRATAMALPHTWERRQSIPARGTAFDRCSGRGSRHVVQSHRQISFFEPAVDRDHADGCFATRCGGVAPDGAQSEVQQRDIRRPAFSGVMQGIEPWERTNALDGVVSRWENLEAEYALVQEALTAELNQVKP